MYDVKTLEKAVQALAPDELAEFRRWFAEFDSAERDADIEMDLANGKLDALLAEAEDEHQSGERKPL